jgi:hypothetical protein
MLLVVAAAAAAALQLLAHANMLLDAAAAAAALQLLAHANMLLDAAAASMYVASPVLLLPLLLLPCCSCWRMPTCCLMLLLLSLNGCGAMSGALRARSGQASLRRRSCLQQGACAAQVELATRCVCSTG